MKFSLVSVEFSMRRPDERVGDAVFSDMFSRTVLQVPVLHLFGRTHLHQQSLCIHVHHVMPYFFVPRYDANITALQFGSQLESSAIHRLRLPVHSRLVHHVAVVEAIPFYGYYEEPRAFFKVFVYHPVNVRRLANLLGSTSFVGGRQWQPYEAHLPFHFQFMVDFGLTGMGSAEVYGGQVRRPLPQIASSLVQMRVGQQFVAPAGGTAFSLLGSGAAYFGSCSETGATLLPSEFVLAPVSSDLERHTRAEVEIDITPEQLPACTSPGSSLNAVKCGLREYLSDHGGGNLSVLEDAIAPMPNRRGSVVGIQASDGMVPHMRRLRAKYSAALADAAAKQHAQQPECAEVVPPTGAFRVVEPTPFLLREQPPLSDTSPNDEEKHSSAPMRRRRCCVPSRRHSLPPASATLMDLTRTESAATAVDRGAPILASHDRRLSDEHGDREEEASVDPDDVDMGLQARMTLDLLERLEDEGDDATSEDGETRTPKDRTAYDSNELRTAPAEGERHMAAEPLQQSTLKSRGSAVVDTKSSSAAVAATPSSEVAPRCPDEVSLFDDDQRGGHVRAPQIPAALAALPCEAQAVNSPQALSIDDPEVEAEEDLFASAAHNTTGSSSKISLWNPGRSFRVPRSAVRPDGLQWSWRHRAPWTGESMEAHVYFVVISASQVPVVSVRIQWYLTADEMPWRDSVEELRAASRLHARELFLLVDGFDEVTLEMLTVCQECSPSAQPEVVRVIVGDAAKSTETLGEEGDAYDYLCRYQYDASLKTLLTFDGDIVPLPQALPERRGGRPAYATPPLRSLDASKAEEAREERDDVIPLELARRISSKRADPAHIAATQSAAKEGRIVTVEDVLRQQRGPNGWSATQDLAIGRSSAAEDFVRWSAASTASCGTMDASPPANGDVPVAPETDEPRSRQWLVRSVSKQLGESPSFPDDSGGNPHKEEWSAENDPRSAAKVLTFSKEDATACVSAPRDSAFSQSGRKRPRADEVVPVGTVEREVSCARPPSTHLATHTNTTVGMTSAASAPVVLPESIDRPSPRRQEPLGAAVGVALRSGNPSCVVGHELYVDEARGVLRAVPTCTPQLLNMEDVGTRSNLTGEKQLAPARARTLSRTSVPLLTTVTNRFDTGDERGRQGMQRRNRRAPPKRRRVTDKATSNEVECRGASRGSGRGDGAPNSSKVHRNSRFPYLSLCAVEVLANADPNKCSDAATHPILALIVAHTDTWRDDVSATLFVVSDAPTHQVATFCGGCTRSVGAGSPPDQEKRFDSNDGDRSTSLRASPVVETFPTEAALLIRALGFLSDDMDADVVASWDAIRYGIAYFAERCRRVLRVDCFARLGRLRTSESVAVGAGVASRASAGVPADASVGHSPPPTSGSGTKTTTLPTPSLLKVEDEEGVKRANQHHYSDNDSGESSAESGGDRRAPGNFAPRRSAVQPVPRRQRSVTIGGRAVLNLSKVCRSELKQTSYTLQAIFRSLFGRPLPYYTDGFLATACLDGLTGWKSQSLLAPQPADCSVALHTRRKSLLATFALQALLDKVLCPLMVARRLDLFVRTSEMAQLYGILFMEVLSRGSQFRVEAFLLRYSKPRGYLTASPSREQVMLQNRQEGIALVMEPYSGFYTDPVVVLDFRSLYPSMMIAYNLCFCTCLGKVSKAPRVKIGALPSYRTPHERIDAWESEGHHVVFSPTSCMFSPETVRRGILPEMVEQILNTRFQVQAVMKLAASLGDHDTRRVLDAQQLGLKLLANVTYGYAAATFTGRMPCSDIADSIVLLGRQTLERAIRLIEGNATWRAKVVYGDTDSLFVHFPGRTRLEAFDIAEAMVRDISAMNPEPVTLKFEKVYHPCMMVCKKRYVGYAYEKRTQTAPTFDAKGIETIRRDQCAATARIMETLLRCTFDNSGNLAALREYFTEQVLKLVRYDINPTDVILRREVKLGTYASESTLPPAARVALQKIHRDSACAPLYGERVPYLVVAASRGSGRLMDLVEDPLRVLQRDVPFSIHADHYMEKHILPALERVFHLVGVDFRAWYAAIPRRGLSRDFMFSTSLVTWSMPGLAAQRHHEWLSSRDPRGNTRFSGASSPTGQDQGLDGCGGGRPTSAPSVKASSLKGLLESYAPSTRCAVCLTGRSSCAATLPPVCALCLGNRGDSLAHVSGRLAAVTKTLQRLERQCTACMWSRPEVTDGNHTTSASGGGVLQDLEELQTVLADRGPGVPSVGACVSLDCEYSFQLVRVRELRYQLAILTDFIGSGEAGDQSAKIVQRGLGSNEGTGVSDATTGGGGRTSLRSAGHGVSSSLDAWEGAARHFVKRGAKKDYPLELD